MVNNGTHSRAHYDYGLRRDGLLTLMYNSEGYCAGEHVDNSAEIAAREVDRYVIKHVVEQLERICLQHGLSV